MLIILSIYTNINAPIRNNSDDWGDSMPTPDVLTNVEDENQFDNPLHRQKSTKKRKSKSKDIRSNSTTTLGAKRKQSQTRKEIA